MIGIWSEPHVALHDGRHNFTFFFLTLQILKYRIIAMSAPVFAALSLTELLAIRARKDKPFHCSGLAKASCWLQFAGDQPDLVAFYTGVEEPGDPLRSLTYVCLLILYRYCIFTFVPGTLKSSWQLAACVAITLPLISCFLQNFLSVPSQSLPLPR